MVMLESPRDLSGWDPADIIRAWQEAFIWANGNESQRMTYSAKTGWFYVWVDGFTRPACYRRRGVAAMIRRLGNEPKASKEKEAAHV